MDLAELEALEVLATAQEALEALEVQVTSLVDPAISQEVLDIFPVAQATSMAEALTMYYLG
ncbi:hypothetical protein ASL11_32605 [Paenibacillus sp. Soil750]|nr:hypothetical protein ASL11_32605 [Paenibacillus sp. Soil750]